MIRERDEADNKRAEVVIRWAEREAELLARVCDWKARAEKAEAAWRASEDFIAAASGRKS